MPAINQISDVGMPVELDKIERELKKLWDEGGAVATRASLVNLAVYSEEADSISRNTEIISRITEHLACRALVIYANRAAKEDRVQTWINAHCHAASGETRQVCSEQLSFYVEGPCVRLLTSIVFSHLDSDLPFYLWWQGEFHDPMDSELWAWVDRLIYDSHTWQNFPGQMRLLEEAQSEARHRVVLCDLNWTRLVPIRLALAQFFDHPASHHHLTKIDRLQIDFARGYRSTAVLLAGWIAAQLQWKSEKKTDDGRLPCRDEAGKPVEILLNERAGEPIGRCILRNDAKEFRVTHAAEADLLEVSCARRGEEGTHQFMPAAENDPVALMKEELMRGGPHRVYLRALEQVRDFF